jgi:hypothetical protein
MYTTVPSYKSISAIKSGIIRGVISLEGDSLIVFCCPNATEI